MEKKILYATDMDRTIIFSKRFIDEHGAKTSYVVAETKDDKVISYISSPVKKKINEVCRHEQVELVPVTTRSISEFNRINIGLNNKYAIVSNGGIILENGKSMKEWEEYISKHIDLMELADVTLDLNELDSISRDATLIDNRYLFAKTENGTLFDEEVAELANRYPNIIFTRQRKKIYAIPECFSKAIALRWLQNKLGIKTVVASGDSELDIPMLAIANYAVIPEHGDAVQMHMIEEGRIVDGGINSALNTFKLIDTILKDGKA